MKRILFFICALLLFFDLADDGYLGKVNYVGPQGQRASWFKSVPIKLEKIDLEFGLPPPKSPVSPHFCQYLAKSIEFVLFFTTSGCHLLSSSGGIPL
jgi:hypothetical protein